MRGLIDHSKISWISSLALAQKAEAAELMGKIQHVHQTLASRDTECKELRKMLTEVQAENKRLIQSQPTTKLDFSPSPTPIPRPAATAHTVTRGADGIQVQLQPFQPSSGVCQCGGVTAGGQQQSQGSIRESLLEQTRALLDQMLALPPSEMDPSKAKTFVDTLRQRWEAKNEEDQELAANTTDNLGFKQYSKPAHFVNELVQNADDARYAEGIEPRLYCTLTDRYMLLSTNERGISAKDVQSLSTICKSTKVGGDSTGMKGIGFKSVFLVTKSPTFRSGSWCFGFRAGRRTKHKQLDWMTPLWCGDSSDASGGTGGQQEPIPYELQDFASLNRRVFSESELKQGDLGSGSHLLLPFNPKVVRREFLLELVKAWHQLLSGPCLLPMRNLRQLTLEDRTDSERVVITTVRLQPCGPTDVSAADDGAALYSRCDFHVFRTVSTTTTTTTTTIEQDAPAAPADTGADTVAPAAADTVDFDADDTSTALPAIVVPQTRSETETVVRKSRSYLSVHSLTLQIPAYLVSEANSKTCSLTIVLPLNEGDNPRLSASPVGAAGASGTPVPAAVSGAAAELADEEYALVAEPEPENGWPVCTTLPMMYLGFRFLLNGAWATASSRENINEASAYNQMLRDRAAGLLVQAVLTDSRWRSRLVDLLPAASGASDKKSASATSSNPQSAGLTSFWRMFVDNVATGLQSRSKELLGVKESVSARLPNPSILSLFQASTPSIDGPSVQRWLSNLAGVEILRPGPGLTLDYLRDTLRIPKLSMLDFLKCFPTAEEDGRVLAETKCPVPLAGSEDPEAADQVKRYACALERQVFLGWAVSQSEDKWWRRLFELLLEELDQEMSDEQKELARVMVHQRPLFRVRPMRYGVLIPSLLPSLSEYKIQRCHLSEPDSSASAGYLVFLVNKENSFCSWRPELVLLEPTSDAETIILGRLKIVPQQDPYISAEEIAHVIVLSHVRLGAADPSKLPLETVRHERELLWNDLYWLTDSKQDLFRLIDNAIKRFLYNDPKHLRLVAENEVPELALDAITLRNHILLVPTANGLWSPATNRVVQTQTESGRTSRVENVSLLTPTVMGVHMDLRDKSVVVDFPYPSSPMSSDAAQLEWILRIESMLTSHLLCQRPSGPWLTDAHPSRSVWPALPLYKHLDKITVELLKPLPPDLRDWLSYVPVPVQSGAESIPPWAKAALDRQPEALQQLLKRNLVPMRETYSKDVCYWPLPNANEPSSARSWASTLKMRSSIHPKDCFVVMRSLADMGIADPALFISWLHRALQHPLPPRPHRAPLGMLRSDRTGLQQVEESDSDEDEDEEGQQEGKEISDFWPAVRRAKIYLPADKKHVRLSHILLLDPEAAKQAAALEGFLLIASQARLFAITPTRNECYWGLVHGLVQLGVKSQPQLDDCLRAAQSVARQAVASADKEKKKEQKKKQKETASTGVEEKDDKPLLTLGHENEAFDEPLSKAAARMLAGLETSDTEADVLEQPARPFTGLTPDDTTDDGEVEDDYVMELAQWEQLESAVLAAEQAAEEAAKRGETLPDADEEHVPSSSKAVQSVPALVRHLASLQSVYRYAEWLLKKQLRAELQGHYPTPPTVSASSSPKAKEAQIRWREALAAAFRGSKAHNHSLVASLPVVARSSKDEWIVGRFDRLTSARRDGFANQVFAVLTPELDFLRLSEDVMFIPSEIASEYPHLFAAAQIPYLEQRHSVRRRKHLPAQLSEPCISLRLFGRNQRVLEELSTAFRKATGDAKLVVVSAGGFNYHIRESKNPRHRHDYLASQPGLSMPFLVVDHVVVLQYRATYSTMAIATRAVAALAKLLMVRGSAANGHKPMGVEPAHRAAQLAVSEVHAVLSRNTWLPDEKKLPNVRVDPNGIGVVDVLCQAVLPDSQALLRARAYEPLGASFDYIEGISSSPSKGRAGAGNVSAGKSVLLVQGEQAAPPKELDEEAFPALIAVATPSGASGAPAPTSAPAGPAGPARASGVTGVPAPGLAAAAHGGPSVTHPSTSTPTALVPAAPASPFVPSSSPVPASPVAASKSDLLQPPERPAAVPVELTLTEDVDAALRLSARADAKKPTTSMTAAAAAEYSPATVAPGEFIQLSSHERVGVLAERFFSLRLEEEYRAAYKPQRDWISRYRLLFHPLQGSSDATRVDDTCGYDFVLQEDRLGNFAPPRRDASGKLVHRKVKLEIKGVTGRFLPQGRSIILSGREFEVAKATLQHADTEAWILVVIENADQPAHTKVARIVNYTDNPQALNLEPHSFVVTFPKPVTSQWAASPGGLSTSLLSSPPPPTPPRSAGKPPLGSPTAATPEHKQIRAASGASSPATAVRSMAVATGSKQPSRPMSPAASVLPAPATSPTAPRAVQATSAWSKTLQLPTAAAGAQPKQHQSVRAAAPAANPQQQRAVGAVPSVRDAGPLRWQKK